MDEKEQENLRLLFALIKRSRRSDRELAKVLKVSQPTVTRKRAKLEKEGYIREYTVIPDFPKLGFQIMSVIFTKFKSSIPSETLEEIRKKVRDDEKKHPSSILLE